MAHYSGDQPEIKQEISDEQYDDYKYDIRLDELEVKIEVQDRETSDYEFRIKEELEKINQENVAVNKEYDCDDITIKSEEFDIKEETVDDLIIEYECLICKSTVFDKVLLLSHILDHGKHFLCKICLKSFPRAGLKYANHKCIPYAERPFECDLCQKRYTERSNLIRHKRIHNPQHLVTKQFKYKTHRWQTNDKPFLCDMCHKRYYKLCHLERHQLTHTGVKPFQCEVCHKRFADNTNLTNHRRSHTDERTYECTLCNKWFKTSSNLINHARVHTDERPYKCNICEKTFRKNSNLTSHQRVHRIDQMIDDYDVDTKYPRKRGHNVKREMC